MGKKLLVVVDYQQDFVEGALGFEKAVSLENGIYNKVSTYLNQEDVVIFTYDTHEKDYLETREGKNLPVPHCILGTEGHKLYGKLKEYEEVENTYHINKQVFALAPESLIQVRDELAPGIDEVELVGVVTNMCVISNTIAMQMIYPNADIFVDASLCASFNEELHEKALDVIESIQVKVTNRG